MIAMRAFIGVLRGANLPVRVEQNGVPDGPLIVVFVVLEEREQLCPAGVLIAFWVLRFCERRFSQGRKKGKAHLSQRTRKMGHPAGVIRKRCGGWAKLRSCLMATRR